MNVRWGQFWVVCLAVASLVAAFALIGCSSAPVPTKGASAGASAGTSTGASTEAPAATDAPAKPLSLSIGETATYGDLKVTVVSAGKGPKDYKGKASLAVKVTYDNSAGTEAASFNEYDWQTEDAGGARARDTAFLMGNAKSLGSGDVAPGGKKTGTIYFAGGKFTKVIYEPSFLSSEENLAAWLLK